MRGSVSDAIQKSEVLLELAKRAEKQDRTESKKRAKAIAEWRKDTQKSLPSQVTKSFFETMGTWKNNSNGTISAEVRVPVPRHAQSRYDAFKEWFMDWELDREWLRREPLWYAVGFQVGDVERSAKARYDRIHGRVAISSYWGKSETMSPLSVGLGMIMTNMREIVAKNVIFAKRRVTAIVLFGYFGPVAPIY